MFIRVEKCRQDVPLRNLQQQLCSPTSVADMMSLGKLPLPTPTSGFSTFSMTPPVLRLVHAQSVHPPPPSSPHAVLIGVDGESLSTPAASIDQPVLSGRRHVIIVRQPTRADPRVVSQLVQQAKQSDEQEAMIKLLLKKQLTHCETDLQAHESHGHSCHAPGIA